MRIAAFIVRGASAHPRVDAATMDSTSGTTMRVAVVGHHFPHRRLLRFRMAHLTATYPNASTLASLRAGLTLATRSVASLMGIASAFRVALGTSGFVRRGMGGRQPHISAARRVSQMDATLEKRGLDSCGEELD